MGAFDRIAWHTDLPDLPEEIKPWSLGFQTKCLPRSCQRIFEVTPEGRLQERKYVGPVASYKDDLEVLARRVQAESVSRKLRYESGAMLDPKDYATIPSDYSGDTKITSIYGRPHNGRLTYNVNFRNGTVQSVELIEHIKPDPNAWDDMLSKRKASGRHFVVTSINDETDISTESN